MSKKMKTLAAKTDQELLQMVAELKQELLGMRFQNKTGSLESPAKIKHARKSIAQALTILSSRGVHKNQVNTVSIKHAETITAKEAEAEGKAKTKKAHQTTESKTARKTKKKAVKAKTTKTTVQAATTIKTTTTTKDKLAGHKKTARRQETKAIRRSNG